MAFNSADIRVEKVGYHADTQRHLEAFRIHHFTLPPVPAPGSWYRKNYLSDSLHCLPLHLAGDHIHHQLWCLTKKNNKRTAKCKHFRRKTKTNPHKPRLDDWNEPIEKKSYKPILPNRNASLINQSNEKPNRKISFQEFIFFGPKYLGQFLRNHRLYRLLNLAIQFKCK